MAILDILHYPDSRLRTLARPVEQVDSELRQLIADMFDTMYQAPGIGLAATQVNVHRRLIVMDVSDDRSDPLVLINPQIIDKGGDESMDEGCLSVPGYYEKVSRAEWVQIKALNGEGEAYELRADGLKAVCIQHEIDHLDGKLFVDYLSGLKRQRIRKKLEKEAKSSDSASGADSDHRNQLI
jgi:peptide deformylase